MKKTKLLRLSIFMLFVTVFTGIFLWLFKKEVFFSAAEFISQTEAKTFDLRQKTLSKGRKPSKDIVIVGIDNVSHEFLTSHFGTWPMPRSVYADFINYVESQNPAALGIDVLFIGSWHKNKENDIFLAETFKKYDNLFGAVYFDDYPIDHRKPLKLPQAIKSEVISKSDISPYSYNNLRELFPELLESTSNLGHLNLERSKDGVIRTLPLFVDYRNDENQLPQQHYANFALKILSKYLGSSEYKIDKNYNLTLSENQKKTRKIPILTNTESVLNWYETAQDSRVSSFEYVTFKDVFLSMESQKTQGKSFLPEEFFKDKIVILGFCADSLSDLKTVPTTKLIPGVEIYATFISNALDGSLIKKVDYKANILISLFLFSSLCWVLFKVKSESVNILTTFSVASIYVWFSFFVMKYFYLWVPLLMPLVSIAFAYVVILALKYFFKSEDYEEVYKLATQDSLTQLYNHRFFKEQMQINLEYCKRYDGIFSLIMVDIDYFKKFNDTYGHLVGDAVLRQVAELLKKSIRKADIICRYGGEEIAIILPHTANENARFLANKLCKLVCEHKFQVSKDEETNVTISLGVSTYPESGDTVTDLIEVADKCLYKAKQSGRNQVGNLEP